MDFESSDSHTETISISTNDMKFTGLRHEEFDSGSKQLYLEPISQQSQDSSSENSQKESFHSEPKRKRSRPFIDYELLVWIFFLTISILSIVDRFVWNVWPRHLFRVGAGTAGTDRMDGLKPGPWSVKAYDAIARISGRFSIFALNLLFFTMMRTTAAFLSESWIARNIVNFSNHEDANRRLHRFTGIALIILTLAHVWSIVFPCIVSGWSAKVVPGIFEWPLSERTPPGFKDVDIVNKSMSLQVDDVYRIILMTIMLAIIIPLTLRLFKTRWYLGIQLHSFVAIMYFIDIVRRHSHPHSWILNTPFFVAWIGDHLLGMYWRRRKSEIFRQVLSEDYMVMFWRQDVQCKSISPKYFMKHVSSSAMERAHVFTAFENRVGADIAGGRDWSTCLVVRIYHSKRSVRIPSQDKFSHTEKIATASDLDVHTWGPFFGTISERMREAIEDEAIERVAVIGGGSAAGYVLDALQHHVLHGQGFLQVLYTARDLGLFQWMVDLIHKMSLKERFQNVRIVLALTDGSHNDSTGSLLSAVEEARSKIANEWSSDITQTGTESENSENCHLSVQYGRLNFSKHISLNSKVFFEGSGGLQKAVRRACAECNSTMLSGPTFDGDNLARRKLPSALRMNCFSFHHDEEKV